MADNALTKLSYGVYIVTTWVDGRPTGCVANSAMQITSKPATVAVSINRNNYTYECIKKTGKFAISVLAEDSAPSLIGAFGFKSGRDNDKFDGVAYDVKARLPVLRDCCGYIVCDVTESTDMSTHTVFFGEVKDTGIMGDRTPMTYDYYHKVIKGKAPKSAPTYIEERDAVSEKGEAQKTKRKFVCDICGFVYEGDDLPEDYVCPLCGVGREHFKEVK